MPDHVARAQVRVLAEQLGVSPRRLARLQRINPKTLYAISFAIESTIHDDLAPYFERVSRLAPYVPNAVVARIAQTKLPPLVAGRAAARLGAEHPGRIADLMSRFEPAYLADCAPYLDPRFVHVLAPILDAETLLPVSRELMARRDFVTASRFLEHATPELIDSFVTEIDDDHAILLTAALLPTDERLSEVVRVAPRERINEVVVAAVDTPRTTLAGISVLSRIDRSTAAELATHLMKNLDDAQVEHLVAVLARRGALKELRTIAELLPRSTQLRLVNHGLRRTGGAVGGVVNKMRRSNP